MKNSLKTLICALSLAAAPVAFAGETVIVRAVQLKASTSGPARIDLNFGFFKQQYDSLNTRDANGFVTDAFFKGNIKDVCDVARKEEAQLHRQYAAGNHNSCKIIRCEIVKHSIMGDTVELEYQPNGDWDKDDEPIMKLRLHQAW